MLVKKAEDRGQLEFVNLENMVPQDHLLRKIDAAIDFKKIYEFVEDLYCEDNGRPSVDPVVLFKIVLIQHIYGLPSLRRTLEEVSMNLAYRWFIGYPLNEAVPHFSTVSYNFKHRFNHATVEHVFRWVLKSAAEEGYLDTEAIFVDGTHIKASANLKKQAGKAVPKQAKRYAKELFEEVNKDREEHGKKPFSEDSGKKPPEERETVVSTTDPESGIFHKGEHKKCFAYEAHTACDKHNFILGVHVTPGNVPDSTAFDPLYDELCQNYPEHKTVVADSAYKTPWICKRIFESGRVLSTCYTRPKTKEKGHPWWAYVYDEYFDDVICPEYHALHYSTTNRDGYREYKSRAYLCKTCPTRGMCTESAKCEKTFLRHIWQEYVEMAEDIRHMAVYRELYRLRKEKIERVFADAKEKHGMRYTQYRGLAQVTNWVKLKFAAMNLKKLATWKWNCRHPAPDGGKRTRLGKKIQLLFRYFSFFRSCLHAKNLLWFNCHSRFFDRLRSFSERRSSFFARCAEDQATVSMDLTSYPASTTAAVIAASVTLSGTVTSAHLPSRFTATSAAPGRPARALVTCLTQFWHIMPSTMRCFFMVFPPVGVVVVAASCTEQAQSLGAAPGAGQAAACEACEACEACGACGAIGCGAGSAWAPAAEDPCFGLKKRSRSALLTTKTELKLIARAATIGFIFRSKAA